MSEVFGGSTGSAPIRLLHPVVRNAGFGLGPFLTGALVEFCCPIPRPHRAVRNPHLSINYGIMFLSFAIGGVIGPRLAAVIKETYDGSYQMAFIIAAALCVVGLGLALAAGRMRRRQRDTAENSKPIAA